MARAGDPGTANGRRGARLASHCGEPRQSACTNLTESPVSPCRPDGPLSLGCLLFIPPALRPRGAQVSTTLVHRLCRRMTGRVTSMTVAATRTSLGLWLMDMPLVLTLGASADGAIRVGLRPGGGRRHAVKQRRGTFGLEVSSH